VGGRAVAEVTEGGLENGVEPQLVVQITPNWALIGNSGTASNRSSTLSHLQAHGQACATAVKTRPLMRASIFLKLTVLSIKKRDGDIEVVRSIVRGSW